MEGNLDTHGSVRCCCCVSVSCDMVEEERKEKADGAIESIQNCLQSLEPIERCLCEITENASYEKVSEQLSPIEKAKLDVGLAYGLASLLYITLRAQVDYL
jgi:hypothetical protein